MTRTDKWREIALKELVRWVVREGTPVAFGVLVAFVKRIRGTSEAEAIAWGTLATIVLGSQFYIVRKWLSLRRRERTRATETLRAILNAHEHLAKLSEAAAAGQLSPEAALSESAGIIGAVLSQARGVGITVCIKRLIVDPDSKRMAFKRAAVWPNELNAGADPYTQLVFELGACLPLVELFSDDTVPACVSNDFVRERKRVHTKTVPDSLLRAKIVANGRNVGILWIASDMPDAFDEKTDVMAATMFGRCLGPMVEGLIRSITARVA